MVPGRIWLMRILAGVTVLVSGGVGAVATMAATGNLSLVDENKVYVCNFYNYDDSLLYTCDVKPSHDAVYRGQTPSQPSNKTTQYVFTGWDKPLTTILQNTNFHAQFKAETRDILVNFYNWDHSLLQSSRVSAGSIPNYRGETPKKPASETASYVFVGWDKPILSVYQDTNYFARFEERPVTLKVYFYDFDKKTLLYTDEVAYGDSANYRGKELVPPACEEEGFENVFVGWSESLDEVTESFTTYPLYEKREKHFTATFRNYDETILGTDDVVYGGTAVYKGEKPTCPADEENFYVFAGWDKPLENIFEDTTFYAVFNTDRPDCTITFKDSDGEVLETQKVPFGSEVIYQGEEPTKESTEQYDYVFDGWDRNLDSVKLSFDTYPVFKEVLKEFTITYKNWNGTTVLDVQKVPYGADGYDAYDGPTPTRPEDANYTYVFDDWNEDLTSIEGDVTAYALFEAIPKKKATGEGEGSGGQGSGHDGEGEGEGQQPGEPPPPGSGEGPVVVEFRNWNGNELCTDALVAGRTAKYQKDIPLPTREADGRYQNYEFCSWDKDITNVQKSFTTYAQYVIKDDFFDRYIVSFRNDDGSLLYESICEENDMPSYAPTEAPRSTDPMMMFVGWDRAMVPATKSYTIYAKYDQLPPPSGGGADISGGVSGGGEGNQDETPIIHYTSEHQGHVYLREKSFGDFSQNAWGDSPLYEFGEDELSPLNYVNDKIKATGAEDYEMSVHYDVLSQAPAAPSFASTYRETTSDSFLAPSPEEDFTYRYYPAEISERQIEALASGDFTAPEIALQEEKYREFVHRNYLGLTKKESKFFTQFAEENELSADSIEDIQGVCDFIQGYCTYNLHAAPYPNGSHNVIYFLTEAREGICNNFASAMVMTLRALNCPARFTVGYSSMPEGVGIETEVQAKQAHAWVEVYVDGLGWVIFDPTPSADGEGSEINPVYFPFGPVVGEPLLTITVSPDEPSKVYDGKDMGVHLDVEGEYMKKGDRVVSTNGALFSSVGNYLALMYMEIHDKNDKDVTSDYQGKVRVIYEPFEITSRTIKVKTATVEKDYDGEAIDGGELTLLDDTSLAEGHRFEIGERTELTNPGSATNVISFRIVDASNQDVTDCYDIEIEYGTLTVH